MSSAERAVFRSVDRAITPRRRRRKSGPLEANPKPVPLKVPYPPPRDLLDPTSMNAEVPEALADLRSRYQAELEATRGLPDAMSRLQAEVGLRERFGAALGVTIDEWMAAATPEQRARYLPLIQAHRAGARIEFATDGHIVGWWEGKTFHPFAP